MSSVRCTTVTGRWHTYRANHKQGLCDGKGNLTMPWLYSGCNACNTSWHACVCMYNISDRPGNERSPSCVKPRCSFLGVVAPAASTSKGDRGTVEMGLGGFFMTLQCKSNQGCVSNVLLLLMMMSWIDGCILLVYVYVIIAQTTKCILAGGHSSQDLRPRSLG